ncbi:MAG: CBS domain-containing protein [Candidatus Saccharimonadales bacterium]
MLYVLLGINVLLLIYIGAIRISYSSRSKAELRRRANDDDKEAVKVLRRETFVPELVSIHRFMIAVLVVTLTCVSSIVYGWWVGISVALGIVLLYGVVSRQRLVGRIAQRGYDIAEPTLLGWIERTPYIWSLVRGVSPGAVAEQQLESVTQLHDLIARSHGILTSRQKSRLRHSLLVDDMCVKDVMTPRAAIDSVSATELLGPLVLDDLHKTRHTKFPVVEGDVDHVVGMIDLHNLLAIDANKQSKTARTVMNTRVCYIKETDALLQALDEFASSHQHLLIVTNEYQETVGVLSFGDVMNALLGYPLTTQDAHNDD